MKNLFELKPIKDYKVLSASRMTDMPKFYPKKIIEEVKKRRKMGMDVHTLVLWTKHPKALLKDPLHSYLTGLKNEDVQLYIQLTITGLGKIIVGQKPNGKPLIIEPGAPKYEESLSMLPKIIDFAGNPERIRLRIDPIIRIKDVHGNQFSSLEFFPIIIDKARRFGIRTISFSFLENDAHKKVNYQFKKAGCDIIPPNIEEREKTTIWMQRIAKKYNVNIFSCSVPNMPISKCIDGKLLEKLHDKKFPVSLKQPQKRILCGCTESLDIGGWPPKRCYTGCLYCYANPVIK